MNELRKIDLEKLGLSNEEIFEIAKKTTIRKLYNKKNCITFYKINEEVLSYLKTLGIGNVEIELLASDNGSKEQFSRQRQVFQVLDNNLDLHRRILSEIGR